MLCDLHVSYGYSVNDEVVEALRGDMGMAEKDTDKLLHEILEGKNPKIEPINKQDIRNEITNKIHESRFKSVTAIANECCIVPSHLNEFLNGKKNMSRNMFLRVVITLGYDGMEIRKLLHRLGYPELYPKDERDYLILDGIAKKLKVIDIDEQLTNHNLESLYSK